MTLDLLRQFLQHVNLSCLRLSLLESLHDLFRPLATLSARGTLAAALVSVEGAQPRYCPDHVGAFVHDDNSSSTKTRLAIFQTIKIHELVVTHMPWQDWRRRPARDDSFEIVPTAADATTVFVDELAERNAHLFFHGGGIVDVSGDTE